MGSPTSATPPTIIVMIAMTLAKIGRSMKNLENMQGARRSKSKRTGGVVGDDGIAGRRVGFRRDLQFRAGPEQALDDHAILRADLPLDHPHVLEPGPGLDR